MMMLFCAFIKYKNDGVQKFLYTLAKRFIACFIEAIMKCRCIKRFFNSMAINHTISFYFA